MRGGGPSQLAGLGLPSAMFGFSLVLNCLCRNDLVLQILIISGFSSEKNSRSLFSPKRSSLGLSFLFVWFGFEIMTLMVLSRAGDCLKQHRDYLPAAFYHAANF